MRNLTKRQQQVLNKLTQWVEAGRKESLSQVAKHLDLHYVSFKLKLTRFSRHSDKIRSMLLELGRGVIAQTRMSALPIIKHLQIVKDTKGCLSLGFIG